MNISKPDNQTLRDLEYHFGLRPNSLKSQKTASRLLFNSLPLSHEIHYELQWKWWGLYLRVWNYHHSENYGNNIVINGHLAKNDLTEPTYTVAIAEHEKISVIGRFKVVRRSVNVRDFDVSMYELTRKWFF